MIIIPIIGLIVYFAYTGRKTLNDASVKEITEKSVNASQRLLLIFGATAILLAILTGRVDL